MPERAGDVTTKEDVMGLRTVLQEVVEHFADTDAPIGVAAADSLAAIDALLQEHREAIGEAQWAMDNHNATNETAALLALVEALQQ